MNIYFFNSNLNITYWQLGRIFTMKDQFLCNIDSHLIYCYQKLKSKEINNNIRADKYLILIIIGIIVIAGILTTLRIIKGKKRKRRAYELKDEEYEYKPDDNNNNKLID